MLKKLSCNLIQSSASLNVSYQSAPKRSKDPVSNLLQIKTVRDKRKVNLPVKVSR